MQDDKSTIYDKITAIQDEAIAALKKMHVPPYPVHYQKQFNRIFDSLSDNTLRNALDQNSTMDEKIDSMVKYIELAKIAIETFSQTHDGIANVAAQQSDLLNTYDRSQSNNNGGCVQIIDGLAKLGTDMTDELKKSEEKINQLNEQLDDAMLDVTTDPLTHLLNHRKYMEDMGDMLPSGMERTLPLLSLMINADNFKEINAKFGHTAGDKVLYFLAQTIKGMVRSGDLVYRYGGDQFAALINRCEEGKALGIAEKILHKVEHSHLIYSGQNIELTVSIGATMHQQNDAIDTMIKRTEEGLLKSKQAGKNKITFV